MGLSFCLCLHFLSSSIPGLGSLMGLVRGSSTSVSLVTSSLGETASLVLVTPPLVYGQSLALAMLVTPLLVCGGVLSGLLAGDSSSGLGGRISLSFCSW